MARKEAESWQQVKTMRKPTKQERKPPTPQVVSVGRTASVLDRPSKPPDPIKPKTVKPVSSHKSKPNKEQPKQVLPEPTSVLQTPEAPSLSKSQRRRQNKKKKDMEHGEKESSDDEESLVQEEVQQPQKQVKELSVADRSFRVKELIRERGGIEHLQPGDINEIFRLYAESVEEAGSAKVLVSSSVEALMQALTNGQYIYVLGQKYTAESILEFWKQQAHCDAATRTSSATHFIATMDPDQAGWISRPLFTSSFHSAIRAFLLTAAAGRCTHVSIWSPPKGVFNLKWLGMTPLLAKGPQGLWGLLPVSATRFGATEGGRIRFQLVDLDSDNLEGSVGMDNIPVPIPTAAPKCPANAAELDLCAIRHFAIAPVTPTVGCLTVCVATSRTLFIASNDPMAMPPGVNAHPKKLQLIAQIQAIPFTSPQRILAMCFTNDGTHVLCAYIPQEPGSAVIKVWDLSSQKCVVRILNQPKLLGRDSVLRRTETMIPATDDSVLYTIQTDGSICVYPLISSIKSFNGRNPIEVKTPLHHWEQNVPEKTDWSTIPFARAGFSVHPPSCAVLVPDTVWLVSNGGCFEHRSLALWSTATGNLLRTFPCGSDPIVSICAVPNEKHILTTSAASVKIWNLAAKKRYLLKTLNVATPLPSSNQPCFSHVVGLIKDGTSCVTIGESYSSAAQLWGAKVWNVGGLFFPEVQIRRLLWVNLVPDVVNVIVDYLR